MRKTISAAGVKRLPVGTDVFLVREKTGQVGMLWIVKEGRQKKLKGIMGTHKIDDRPGWHYEVSEPI